MSLLSMVWLCTQHCGDSLFQMQTGQMQFLWGKHNEGVSKKELHLLRAS